MLYHKIFKIFNAVFSKFLFSWTVCTSINNNVYKILVLKFFLWIGYFQIPPRQKTGSFFESKILFHHQNFLKYSILTQILDKERIFRPSLILPSCLLESLQRDFIWARVQHKFFIFFDRLWFFDPSFLARWCILAIDVQNLKNEV